MRRICARGTSWAAIALCAAALIAPPAALANTDIADRWDVKYATRTSHNNSGCQLCHDSAAPTAATMNTYGNAMRPLPSPRSNATIDAKILAAENANSDGDATGATNLEEILRGTQPGWTGSSRPGVTGSLDPPTATLSVNNVSKAEGNSGVTQFVFNVTLSSSRLAPVTVNFATASGTATAGTDYTPTSGTLTFAPGTTTSTVTVNVNGDTTLEPDRTFFVNLSTPSNATIAAPQGVGTIVNDDGALANANFQGLFYNSPAESEAGWGINFAHQAEIIFATWFTYDATGKALWLSMTATKTADGVYSGRLIQTGGPAFSAVPFNKALVTSADVGTGTLTFTDGNNGKFAYVFNGVSQTKNITRQIFGAVPSCTFGAQPNLALATNFQDLWYAAPAESEAGWGVNFTHQGDNIFVTWFTYDTDGTPLWLSATAAKTGTGVYKGTLFRTRGPAFNAVPFLPANVVLTNVGNVTLTFTNGDSATFAYTVNGVTQSKAIVRQVFRTPGTVCQ